MLKLFRKKDRLETNFNNAEIMAEEKNIIRCYNKNAGHPIKTLFGFYSRHKGAMTLSTIFFVLKSMPVSILLPIITSNIIDIAVEKPENALELFILNGFFVVGILVFNIVTNTIHLVAFNKAKRSVEASLRGAMVRKLQQLSIKFHKETASGKIQSKIMRDVEAVEGLSAQVFTSFVSIIFNFITALCIILSKNVMVFFIVLIAAPTAALLLRFFHGKINQTNTSFRKGMEKTSSEVMEMIELIPVTKAHALEETEIAKLTNEVTDVAKKGYRMDFVQGMFSAAVWITFTIFQIACLFATGSMALKGLISIGEITLYQSYFNSIINQISGILGLIPAIVKGTESITSIGEIINDGNIEDNEPKEKLKDLRGSYVFKDVKFNYDENTPVLRGLDLEVKEGETIALVGESGSGKSTILNLVIGFNLPDSGEVLIDGKSSRDINLQSYRRYISVVPQNTVLFSGTIRENITYGRPDISDEELGYVIDMAKLRSVVDKLPQGVDTLVGEHGGKLSGGQRQRISIARAIIRHPNVIIFDEATSALDTATEREIQEAINNLTIGRTTFIVAHRLSTIRSADRIAVIKEGRCVEIGTYDELMEKKGEFYKLKELQS